MMRISRAAACVASMLAVSSLVAVACYEPCDYPGESANCLGAGAGTGTTTTRTTTGGCHDCESKGTTCQPFACVAGECKPAAPAPTTVSCGDGGVCDGEGACVACNVDVDCQMTAASSDMRCHEHTCFSCTDGVKNGNEVDVDCGGSCLGCLGETCAADVECKSGTCAKGACRLPLTSPCDDAAACASGYCSPGSGGTQGACAACMGSGQCGGVACDNGTCKADDGAPCGADADCANGKCDAASKLCLKANGDNCSGAEECVSGACTATCAPCSGDFDCVNGECILPAGVCALSKDAYCAPGAAPCATGLTCQGFPATCQ